MSTTPPFAIVTCESGGMRTHLMVIRTFCQLEASEPIDTQRLTLSSAPLSSRDGKSNDMQRYLKIIRTFCQLEASEPVDMQ